jgi:hypothetical protein
MPLSVSPSFSKRVFDDGIAAIHDPRHPCHHMITLQTDQGIRPPQLPEPFFGAYSNLRLVFVGLNPSLSADEVIPIASPAWDFNRYDSHYRYRFSSANRNAAGKPIVRNHNGHEKVPRLWNNVELFGRKFLSECADGNFLLGKHAILTVVHYKSRDGWSGDSAEKKQCLFQHQSALTQALMSELAPCVLVPMGNHPYRQVCLLLGLESDAWRRVTEVTGHTLKAKSKSEEHVLIVPVKHLSYPPSHEIQVAVGREIRRSIGVFA